MRCKTFASPLLVMVAAVLTACGGSDDGAQDSPPSSVTPVATTFSGTAYLKTREVSLYVGKTYGVARESNQGLVDLCNGFRRDIYKLPAVQPDDAVMAGLDVRTKERYFDTDKALDVTTGHGLLLTDMRRWQDELAKSSTGSYPAVPPDCAAHDLPEIKSVRLWRDGVQYELRYDTKKAIGNAGVSAFTKIELPRTSSVTAQALQKVGDESCYPVDSSVVPEVGQGDSCLWNRFPLQSYLTWPWALRSHAVYLGLDTTSTLLAVERDKPLPTGIFDIPSNFTITGL